MRRVAPPRGVSDLDWSAHIAAARAGSATALGELLESCRAYLLLIANQELDADLRAKAAASDLVQETCLEAHRDFATFAGGTQHELLGWLRRVLLHNLGQLRQRYCTARMRDVGREVPLSELCDRGSDFLLGQTSSPSSSARRKEELAALEDALARLPEAYRQVLLLRHREHHPFAEIGRLMGRSEDAVHKLWERAIDKLRRELGIRS